MLSSTSSQSYDFSSSHVWMWELDHKEGWAPKNWCFWAVVLEKTLESPLDWKEIQPVHPKRNQSWIFIGKTDAGAETPIVWPLIWRTDSFEKTLMLHAGRERDDRGWDGWMASLTQWTWAWASSGSWWWTGKPGVLQSMGLQRIRHDWVTELNWWESARAYFSRFIQLWKTVNPVLFLSANKGPSSRHYDHTSPAFLSPSSALRF